VWSSYAAVEQPSVSSTAGIGRSTTQLTPRSPAPLIPGFPAWPCRRRQRAGFKKDQQPLSLVVSCHSAPFQDRIERLPLLLHPQFELARCWGMSCVLHVCGPRRGLCSIVWTLTGQNMLKPGDVRSKMRIGPVGWMPSRAISIQTAPDPSIPLNAGNANPSSSKHKFCNRNSVLTLLSPFFDCLDVVARRR
jgi:hypothetical protein